MKRFLVPAAAVALMLAAAPAAFAQTGPDTAACELASLKVRVAAEAAAEAAADVAAVRAAVLAGLEEEVAEADAALAAAVTAFNAIPTGGDTAAALAALVEAEASLRSALAELAAAAEAELAVPQDLRDALGSAELALQTEIAARVAACAAPSPDPETPPADDDAPYENCAEARADDAAPVLATSPRFQASLDSDGDGIGCEENEGSAPDADTDDSVSVIPSDAPETGDGSTA